MSALPQLINKSPQKQNSAFEKCEIELINYKKIKLIKKGNMSSVYLVQDKRSGKYYAAKVFFCNKNEDIDRQIKLMITINHSTLINFIGFSRYCFDNSKNFTIIMDFAEKGSLNDIFLKKVDNTCRQIIIAGIARGMKYLHDRKIIHRNLKPENILIDENNYPHITDFCFSKPLNYSEQDNQSQYNKNLLYCAPEVIKENEYGPKSDVYSFGFILYSIVMNSDPFSHLQESQMQQLHTKIVEQKYRPTIEVPIQDEIKLLIEQCWSIDPNERPTFNEIFDKFSKDKHYSLDDVNITKFQQYVSDISKDQDCFEDLLIEKDLFISEIERLKSENKDLKEKSIQFEVENIKNKLINRQNNKMSSYVNQIYGNEVDKLYSNFNSLSLLEQNQLIKIMENSKDHQMIDQLTNISKLINYLLNFKELEGENCIEIEINNKTKKGIQIQLKSNVTQILYQNDLFDSSEFIELLKSFTYLSIEIKYPSSNFQQIYDKIINLKFDIAIFIDNIQETDKHFYENKNINSVILSATVKSIVDGSFENCYNLYKISIPSSVDSIGKYAFYECSSLMQIIIPSSVTSIGKYAFYRCSSLMQIIIPSSITSIEDNTFNRCSSLTQIIIPSSVTSIGNSAFENCSSLTHIIIPSSVTSIGNSAFEECSSLTQIIIPSSVTSIGNRAFDGCSSLAQIAIPSSVASIGRDAFRKCSSLTEITIPSSVTSIEYNTFDECTLLMKVTIPSSVTSIEQESFKKCISLKEVVIPSSVRSIYKAAFSLCLSLTQIKIPFSVTLIHSCAFCNCISLKQLIIHPFISLIGQNSFSQCSSLSSIIISDECSSQDQSKKNHYFNKIESGAFNDCPSLTQIIIPPLITSIGNSVFSRCSSLKQVVIPSFITSIGKYVFVDCSSLAHITIPSSVTSFGESIFNGISSLTISGSITFIGDKVFKNCTSLNQIKLPSSITSIGDFSFFKCISLTKMIIPPSVKSLGSYSFKNCSSLIEVKLPSSLISIGDFSFEDCSSLTKIEFPSSLTSIGKFAFAKCTSLVKINVPSSVNSIGDNAFIACSSLADICIQSPKTKIGIDSFLGCKSSKYGTSTRIDDFKLVKSTEKHYVSIVKSKKTGKKYIKKEFNEFYFENICDFKQLVDFSRTKFSGLIRIEQYCFPSQDDNYYTIISEYIEGSSLLELTKDYISSKGRNNEKMNPTIRSKIIFGVAAIMKQFHKSHIMHRNLSIEKVLLDENFEPKISLSRYSRYVFDEKEISMDNDTNEYYTGYYINPQYTNSFGIHVDVYSYAFFVYRMFSSNEEFTDLLKWYKHCKENGYSDSRPERPINISDAYWELIESCWTDDIQCIPSFEEITNVLYYDKFAINEFGMRTDLDQLHKYQNRIDID